MCWRNGNSDYKHPLPTKFSSADITVEVPCMRCCSVCCDDAMERWSENENTSTLQHFRHEVLKWERKHFNAATLHSWSVEVFPFALQHFSTSALKCWSVEVFFGKKLHTPKSWSAAVLKYFRNTSEPSQLKGWSVEVKPVVLHYCNASMYVNALIPEFLESFFAD